MMENENYNIKEMNVPQSICKDCGRSCGKCTWSAMFIPVAGWNAVHTKIHVNKGKEFDSYMVIDCQMFTADKERHVESIRTESVIPFCHAILVSAVRDYARSLIKIAEAELTGRTPNQYARNLALARQSEWWFKSSIAVDMLDVCGIHVDPEQIIRAIKSDPLGVLERLKLNYGSDDQDDQDEPKRVGRPRSTCWENPRLNNKIK